MISRRMRIVWARMKPEAGERELALAFVRD
jgi:hypothetical protein